jgi:L,D-transpeptidase catalytic domain/Putative peptidoglycan binding domain
MRFCSYKTKSLAAVALVFTSVLFAFAQTGARRPTSITRVQTREAEKRLAELGYWTGPVDGVFDDASRSALTTLQKWEGRNVTGRLTLEEFEAIRDSSRPKARDVGYAHVEIDLDRQVLLMLKDSGEVKLIPVSTGSGEEFLDEGQTSVAYTPRGRFIVYDKVVGWEQGPIGAMYYPNYISGGVAIHGARSVPTGPVSHGCIRVPMFAARELSKLMPKGTIVLVYDKISFVSAREWIDNPRLKPTTDIE